MKTFPGFITVRTSSTRLPGKCLLPFGDDMNVLQHVIRRARSYGIDSIVCTSVDQPDDVIEEIACVEGVPCFRGSLSNKLKRWADCASHYGISAFHTVDADDPFFDGEEMRRSYQRLIEGGWDMVCPTEASSSGGASVGYTLTARIVREACSQLADDADTEMMWYYVEKVVGIKKTLLPDIRPASPVVRLTLDYEEDYWLLRSVCRMLGNFASRQSIDDLFMRNPDLHLINWFRNQEWRAGQLAKKC
ncbi:MAG: hypothetical protein M0037_04250 [Betaproteobacteria bacterium]|nr:hypothetical protein [Betaproteobacteria bacterium]